MQRLTIDVNESLSTPLLLPGNQNQLAGFVFDANFGGLGACSFQVSADGVAYQDLYDFAGNEVVYNVVPSTTMAFENDERVLLERWRFLRIRAGVAAFPVVQGIATTIVATGI